MRRGVSIAHEFVVDPKRSRTMPRIVVTAECQDAKKWEKGFRTHADLFKSMTINKPIRISVTSKNEFALYMECKDLDKYMEIMDSKATEKAMAFDGVKRETVKVYVLDKEFDPG
jgi:hypothetical protein